MRPKTQGTRWETEFVSRARAHGIPSSRISEGGSRDRGDVWVGNPWEKAEHTVVALAWKRLVGDRSSRRSPDGVRDVVVVDTDTFLELAAAWLAEDPSARGVTIECKAAQQINVTRTLGKAIRKASR